MSSNANLIVEPASYDEVLTGTIVVGTSAAQLAKNIPCRLVKFKPLSTNAASIFLGYSDGVLTTNGFELEPGDDSGWFPITNLNLLFGISASATQALRYFLVK